MQVGTFFILHNTYIQYFSKSRREDPLIGPWSLIKFIIIRYLMCDAGPINKRKTVNSCHGTVVIWLRHKICHHGWLTGHTQSCEENK